jgi:hypothetical protein
MKVIALGHRAAKVNKGNWSHFAQKPYFYALPCGACSQKWDKIYENAHSAIRRRAPDPGNLAVVRDVTFRFLTIANPAASLRRHTIRGANPRQPRHLALPSVMHCKLNVAPASRVVGFVNRIDCAHFTSGTDSA